MHLHYAYLILTKYLHNAYIVPTLQLRNFQFGAPTPPAAPLLGGELKTPFRYSERRFGKF
jgi:hypothetical protein